jgi:hypothetical protein
VAASWRQGVPREHQWGLGMAPGKAVGGGSHPNGVEAVEKPRDNGVRRRRELMWPVTMESQPCSVGAEEGR